MTAIEAEKPALLDEVERSRTRPHDRFVRAGVAVLAMAAAVGLYARTGSDEVLNPVATSDTTNAPASSLRESVGAGEVRIGSIVATPGATVRSGDTIGTERARAIFERPRKVTWLLEQGTVGDLGRARVKAAGEPLVLGLEEGAIEAQVVPVSTGEAFAVDIESGAHLVRVAVHGTHLRVARVASHVVVDLTEGVVSIGVPPRTGVTYGTLVTAPAHVEFDVTDLGALRIDHAAASVRPAIPLSGRESAVAVVSHPEAPAVALESPTPTLNLPSKASTPKPALPKVEPPVVASRDAVVALIRECATSRSRSGDVHVTVTSELRLHVSAAGVVEAAQFVPPLLPDIQTCAAEKLYKMRFEEGAVAIPIEFSY